MDNKRGTAQSTLCVDNKNDKTEIKGMCDKHLKKKKKKKKKIEFHEFRFKSAIPRIPRLFRDRGKSLALLEEGDGDEKKGDNRISVSRRHRFRVNLSRVRRLVLWVILFRRTRR